ncbi:MAG: hypothetical protein FWE82_06995 [Defluviitaleaceae bacterium]|nr:hypothetical protein [Defluviitaleaceae bacterium]
MVYYFSYSNKTKAYAEALAKIKNAQAAGINSKLNKKNFFVMMRGCFLAIRKKEMPVDEIPALEASGEIFVCSPIWAGNIVPPARYFLNRAELNGRRVNLLLTCESIHQSVKYKKAAADVLSGIDCVPGTVEVFCTSETIPEPEVLDEQLRAVYEGEPESA